MEEIEFIRTPYKKRRTLIEARSGTQIIGKFDYLPPLYNSQPVKIGFISVHGEYRRKGVAAALLREFGEDVGGGISVVSIVTHDETLDYLEPYNPDPEASKKLIFTIVDPTSLENIPIARVFKAGGIQIIKFRVTYNPKEVRLRTGNNIHNAMLRGITSPNFRI